MLSHHDEPPGDLGRRARRDRSARDVRAASADERPRPGAGRGSGARRRRRDSGPSSRRLRGARPRLGTGRHGRPANRRFGDPSRRARRRSRAGSSSRVAPAVAAECGRAPRSTDAVAPARPEDARSLGALVDLPAERIEDEVPGPDVADLSATEAGLEMGDPARGEAPQVVTCRALLARRPDRLPLEEVVRSGVAAGLRSCRHTARRPASRSGRGRASRAARLPASERRAGGRGRAAGYASQTSRYACSVRMRNPARSAVSR